MIRSFEDKDLESVMDIWLNTNIQAHSFITKQYWEGNYDLVKRMLPGVEIYVYESEGKVRGFVGVDHGYIAGIFVSVEAQSKGIGKQLLNTAKERYSELSLKVYKKNRKAVRFYQRELFVIKQEQLDESPKEVEYLMVWTK